MSAMVFFSCSADSGTLLVAVIRPQPIPLVPVAVSVSQTDPASRPNIQPDSKTLSRHLTVGRGTARGSLATPPSRPILTSNTKTRLASPPAPATLHQPSRKILSPSPVAFSPSVSTSLPAPPRARREPSDVQSNMRDLFRSHHLQHPDNKPPNNQQSQSQSQSQLRCLSASLISPPFWRAISACPALRTACTREWARRFNSADRKDRYRRALHACMHAMRRGYSACSKRATLLRHRPCRLEFPSPSVCPCPAFGPV